jgi:acyl-CoA-binding protein
MQADCFQAYIQCAQANAQGTLAQDLLCTLTLIRCSNAHLYGSIGEHRVERPGEADVTGEAVFEGDAVLKLLETRATEVQAYVKRARELAARAGAPEQDALWDALARDLDHFVQTVIQEFQQLKS